MIADPTLSGDSPLIFKLLQLRTMDDISIPASLTAQTATQSHQLLHHIW
jgi:hypothetical protein